MRDAPESTDDKWKTTWIGAPPPPRRRYGVRDWLRVARRGLPLAIAVFGGLALLLVLRLGERPLFGSRRPLTPWITRGVCVSAFWWLGIRRVVHGRPMTGAGGAVANHCSWLDIFALNASDAVYFVAKSEVAAWPGIGWLARATGTVFIRRQRSDAAAHAALLSDRLDQDHRLLFFPEGTSSDGLRVLPFKPTLFAPFFADHRKNALQVQPITVKYTAPAGRDPRVYGWWGDMEFGAHLLSVLACAPQGRVDVTYHRPLKVGDYPDRKALAAECEAIVRAALVSDARREGGRGSDGSAGD